MGKPIITCPKDPEMKYFQDVCKEIFRKDNIRNWCKSCDVFLEQKETADDAS